jgi:hypothetical protein
MKGEEGQRIKGGVLGLGLLLGGATFAYGYSCGCRKAEILAINDDGKRGTAECEGHWVKSVSTSKWLDAGGLVMLSSNVAHLKGKSVGTMHLLPVMYTG